ncbi:MAG: PASTA domain-containing protein [Fimbriimonadaceae bacterium]|nr:PASTA domain-containing protein [Fimbriimonadaceae bacterium]
MSGTLIDGRYRLRAELRRDADLVTYDAVDERLGRPVTLRLVKAERSGDPAYLERYRTAVARAAALNHPHVVPVYDSNLSGQQPFVVEGHVDGPSLADLLASGERLAPRAVVRLAQQAAAALAAAHGGGVVHGTISPECLLLDENGDLRIADFTRPPLANPAVAVVRYQAPEQVLGSPADPRSDVFALGAVLYHLIDGQPPFDGADPAAVNLAKISNRPRPLESVAPDLPRPLLRAVEQSLATNPADRPAHGGAFRDLLDLAAVAAAGLPAAVTAPTAALDATQVLQPTQVLPARDLSATGYQALPPQTAPAPRRARPAPEPEPSGGVLPWLSLVVVLAVVAGLYFALRNPNARPADQPLVPALINKTEGEALTEARAAGLQVQVASRANSDTVPGGQVLEQAPAAGEPLPEDKVIKLVLSLGPRFVTVPTVVGMTAAEAKKTLPKYGLRVAVQMSEDPSQPDGTVIAQAPQAGQKADKGGLVRIQVNKLPKESVLPPDSSTAEPTPDSGPSEATGGPVEGVVDEAVDAAKKRAGEAIDEIGDKAKERAKEEIDKIKERGREKVKEARDELVKGVKDRLSGGGDTPEKGR